MIPEENRFESDYELALAGEFALPSGWEIGTPDPGADADVEQLTNLLRAHQQAGKGSASAGADDILLEISEEGVRTRENLVIRDDAGIIRAWGSVHDRAINRMLFVHIVDHELTGTRADHCSNILFDWADTQAREVGAARGLTTQQIDTGAFENDERQQEWLAGAGFDKVRTWWQMSRPVTAEDADLVPDPKRWSDRGVTFRLVDRESDDYDAMAIEDDLRAVHTVLEGAFEDHFNSRHESYDEFLHRVRQEPGHRWNHWWIAEINHEDGSVEAAGALAGSQLGPDENDPDRAEGSYVDYIGVLANARGRGVAKGLLRTIIADTARRGRSKVGLEVDATSPTGADGLYTSLGWETDYITQSWHRDVKVAD